MFKHSVIGAALAAFFFVSVATAHAQTAADQITSYNLQIELAQKQRQLNDLLGEDAILTKMPQVVAVMGIGGVRKARLMLKSGVTLTYGEDDVINSRMRVVAITPREVVVAITPAAGSVGAVKGKKGKESKVADPVLMPLEFLAGAQQGSSIMGQGGMGPGGMPGTPGTPVQSGPIPESLRQAPPMVQGAGAAGWPSLPPAAQQPAQAAAAAPAPAAASGQAPNQ